MAWVFDIAVGILGEPPIRAPRDIVRTWTWLHSPAFRATPLDMKAEANLHFLQGINETDRARLALLAALGRRARMSDSSPPPSSTITIRGGS